MNLNKVFLIGRIVRDLELKSTPGGTSVAKFSLATNHVYVGKDGEKKETAQFHNCVVFGKQAENASRYLVKGQEAMIEGRIEYRAWDKKDGTKGYATEIMADRIQFGQKPTGGAKPKENGLGDGFGKEDDFGKHEDDPDLNDLGELF